MEELHDEDYDVIIVGTGAGGGTLARHLALSGKRILLLERATGCPVSRRTGPPPMRSPTTADLPRHVVRRRGQGIPALCPLLRGRRHRSYGAALHWLRREDFGELKHHDGLSPAWPIGYDDMEPYHTKAEQLYQVHGARGEDPTEPPASAPHPFPALSHEPRIQQLSDDLAAAAATLPRPVWRSRRRGQPAVQPCIPLRDPRRVPVPGPRQVRRRGPWCPAPRAPQRHAGHRRPSGQAGDQRRRHRRHRDRGRPRRDPRGLTADLYVVPCGAANSAKLLLASASDAFHPNGLANGSDQVGRNYMFHNSQVRRFVHELEPDRLPEDLNNDFYFGSWTLRVSDGQHPDDRQVTGRDVQG